jgi:FKBP-type peptidyl-prolyl cis-trans isomerase FkpA
MKALLPLLFSLVMACGGRDGRVPVVQRQQPTGEEMIRGNQAAVKLEDRDIDLYVERYGLNVQRTGRGVRYQLLRDEPGTLVRPDQWAVVNYRVELLNGDTAYATTPGEPESFKVEMDDVESGLHEGIQFLSPGDSAIIIIPSYRAHGLIGDMDRIPMRSTVVYHIGLVKVRSGTR